MLRTALLLTTFVSSAAISSPAGLKSVTGIDDRAIIVKDHTAERSRFQLIDERRMRFLPVREGTPFRQ